MSRNAVVYHLGAHKTASSLLQKFMRDREDQLRAAGVTYLGRSEMNDCVGWGKRLLKRPEILQGRIEELLAPRWADLLVTSHENTLGPPIKVGGAHLYPRGPEIAARLAQALERWDAKALLYLRPQDEFLESYYLQRIHQGAWLTFDEWLDAVDLERLSWRPLVEAVQEAFGPERVEVVDFGLIRQGQSAFIADFLRRVDPGLDVDTDYAPVRNPSISAKGLAIARAANPHLRADWERKAMRKFLQKHFNNRKGARPDLLSDEQRAWVRERYDAEYAELTGGRAAVPPGEGTGP